MLNESHPAADLCLRIHARCSTRFNPTSTRAVFERSPMMLLTGSGNFRTNVGTARIWSSRASCGRFRRSITSSLYLPFNCSSQINLRFLSAVTDFGECPATYNRKTHLSLPALAGRTVHRPAFDVSRLTAIGRSFRYSFGAVLLHTSIALSTHSHSCLVVSETFPSCLFNPDDFECFLFFSFKF